MSKCACGEHMTHIVFFSHIHDTETLDVHSGLSDTGISCSQTMWAFISMFDSNSLPTAELERHYLQHGRNIKNAECECILFVHAADYMYKCLTKCLVQTTVAPPS